MRVIAVGGAVFNYSGVESAEVNQGTEKSQSLHKGAIRIG
jgi:hypothetical protein